MGAPEFSAAMEEIFSEEWADVHSEVRERLANIGASDGLGRIIADAFRAFFRLGMLRGYVRGLKDAREFLK